MSVNICGLEKTLNSATIHVYFFHVWQYLQNMLLIYSKENNPALNLK